MKRTPFRIPSVRELLIVSVALLLVTCMSTRPVAQSASAATPTATGGTIIPGDGGAATSAIELQAAGFAFDPAGNLYVADCSCSCIRKIDPAGIISTIAGTGKDGYEGDGGPAVAARLYTPYWVSRDAHGNLFIVDHDNHCIRRIDPSGIISTIAGTGQPGFSGDGGPAVDARLNRPGGMAIDSLGNIYIADLRNSRIRKVDTAGVITTVAGTDRPGYSGDGGPAISAQLHEPGSVTLDSNGNLYIADSGNQRIRVIDAAGVIRTVAGDGKPGHAGDGGPATDAELFNPWCPILDSSGNLYIADAANSRVRKVDTNGMISTVAGTGVGGFSGDGGPAAAAQLSEPVGLAFDAAGNLYIADFDNFRIRKVDTAGVISTFAGSAKPGPNLWE